MFKQLDTFGQIEKTPIIRVSEYFKLTKKEARVMSKIIKLLNKSSFKNISISYEKITTGEGINHNAKIQGIV